MEIIYPLKTEWHISEDQGFVPDQIQNRVNSESNYEWSKNRTFTSDNERIEYSIKKGREYLKSK